MGESKADPATTSILQEILLSTVRQMVSYIEWSSPNYVASIVHDLSMGIFTAKGEAIALESHISGQSIGYFQIGLLLEEFGIDDIAPGDMFVMCDPHLGAGTHSPDWSFFRPVFYEEKLEFFVMARTHQMDNGSWKPTSYNPLVYDIHSEGIRLRPTKFFEKDQPTKVYTLIMDNVRHQNLVKMDHLAMSGSMKFAEKRLIELLDKYGRDTVFACIGEMWRATSSAVREEIDKFPDGVYQGESSCDDDGITLDVPVTVRVTAKKTAHKLVLDFSDSDKQVKGQINASRSLTHVKSSYSIYCCLPPELSKHYNQGSFDAFELVTRPGTVTDAKYPAPCGACTLVVATQIIESVWMALAEADPMKVPAAGNRPLNPAWYANDPRTGRGMHGDFHFFLPEGGSGAFYGYDGWPNVQPPGALGTLRKPSIELTEVLYPFLAIQYRINQDACGHGRWRGGVGTIWEFENYGEDAWMVSGAVDGVKSICRKAGRLGGTAGKFNQMILTRKDVKTSIAARRHITMEVGDRLLNMSGGGSGVGRPMEREVEDVKEDVEEGVITIDTAREVYGVVIDPETFEIDYKATQKSRSTRR